MTALPVGQDLGTAFSLRSAVVIGTGLIGTSVALALRGCGVSVWLDDADRGAARLAADIGAGTLLPESSGPPTADLAVLAVPPAAVAETLATAQARRLSRWYTDVASVKDAPLRQARDLGCDLSAYVPGHPLSGRERSGPAAARADLFLGRPWVICPGPQTAPEAIAAVAELVRCCRAEPVRADPGEHDRWVALVSHAPHVVAAAMAARLAEAPERALALAGQGLRDVTRIAAGDAALWTQILGANAAPVAQVLGAVAADLAAAAQALAQSASPAAGAAGAPSGRAAGPRQGAAASGRVAAPRADTGAGGRAASAARGQASLRPLTALLGEGSAGVARIPGKRGRPVRDDTVVQVVIRDVPGQLARLFEVAGQAGVNIEDIGIEHSPGLPVGVAELTVAPGAAARLTEALAAAGWPVRR